MQSKNKNLFFSYTKIIKYTPSFQISLKKAQQSIRLKKFKPTKTDLI